MLLEGSEDFRKHFFEVLGDEALSQSAGQWRIEVEQHEIDILMARNDTVVIIENKIAEGSLSKGQLLRYYLEQRARTPNHRIVAVMLAPRRVGVNEVKLLCESNELVESDTACHLQWESVLKIPECFNDPNAAWIKQTLSNVEDYINQLRGRKLALEGDRGVLNGIIDELLRRVASTSPMEVAPYKVTRIQEVYSCKNTCTMAVGFEFDCESEGDREVKGVTQPDGSLLVTLRSYLKLSGLGKKHVPAADAWQRLQIHKELPVPGVGDFILQPNGSYLWFQEARAARDEILQHMSEIWLAVENFARANNLVHELR
jgi:hypothetical protein